MSKLDELINKLCPDGVEWRVLNAVAEVYDGTHKTPDYKTEGVPFISVENIKNIYSSKKFISREDFDAYKIKPQINDVFMTRIGSIGVCAVFDKQEDIAYYVSLALIRPNTTLLNSKFLKYVIESNLGKKELKKRTLVNAVPIKVNKDDVGKISIPVPPLEIQNEIVRILDNFTKLEEELEEELEARRKQYEYYRDSLLSFDDSVEWTTLENIADIGTGSSNTNEGLTEGLYPFYVRSPEVRRKNTYEYDETAIITSGDGVGVGKIFHYVEGKYALHQRAYRIHINTNKIIPKFYYFYMKTTFYSYINKEQFKASVQSIRRPMLNKYPVPIPSIKDQERIVSIMERFEIICSDINSGLPAEIEARHKQYEYYRDKLLTFKRKSA